MSIIRNLDIVEYHNHPAQSSSKISDFINEGPLWFKRRHHDKAIAGPDSKDMKRGRLFDEVMTEPAKVEATYIMQPDTYPGKDGPTKWHNGATFCKEFNARIEAQGLIAIPEKEWERVSQMREAALEHPIAKQLIAACEPQVSIRQKMAALGFELQSRPDGLSTKGCAFTKGKPFRIDFKKTSKWGDWHNAFDPKSRRIGRSVVDYGYHRQAAIADCLCALEPGLGANMPHYLIVVEDAEPFRVGVFLLSEAFLATGWREVELAMQQIANCIKTKTWPGSPLDVVTLNEPSWFERHDEQLERQLATAAGAR